MPKLIILGSSNAIPDWEHENTHMVVSSATRIVLIDCVNNTLLRLEKVGIEFNDLSDLILTHFHPDHVSGVPQLLMNMWLMGRRKPLAIHGLSFTNKRIKNLMDFYGWSDWPNFFQVNFYNIPSREMSPVISDDGLTILASPVQHFVPTIGLRINFSSARKAIAYSCDTEPCAQVIRLAQGADVLIHEASGLLPGHSSAEQAGETAHLAGVNILYLIHYPTGKFAGEDPVGHARKKFAGSIFLAKDYMPIEV